MDVYQSKPVFKLVSVKWVKSMGYAIMNTLWVRKIKLNGAGTFSKLNPRWCAMGTNMDRDLYESYAEVCLWSTVHGLVVGAKAPTFSRFLSGAGGIRTVSYPNP